MASASLSGFVERVPPRYFHLGPGAPPSFETATVDLMTP
jgi:hypothetical protein